MPVILAGQGGKPFTLAKTRSPAWKFFLEDILVVGLLLPMRRGWGEAATRSLVEEVGAATRSLVGGKI